MDWERVAASGLLDAMNTLVSSSDFTFADLNAWSYPLLCVAHLGDEAARSGLLLVLTHAFDRLAENTATTDANGRLDSLQIRRLAMLHALVDERAIPRRTPCV